MDNSMINLSICLSDIPKNRIKKASNGKLYIGVSIRKRKEPDQFDQDIYAYVQQSKEEREAKEEKQFVGNGKLINFTQNVSEMAPASADDTDDLPF